MVLTTWDGHLRIDHLAEEATVALTLVTVESATELRLRSGLRAGFVTVDRQGPPAYVEVEIREGGLPADIAQLLGPRVAAAVAELIASGRAGRWLQLDLREIDGLAAAWAPYRRVTLAAEQPVRENRGALGAWAGELWTCLGLPDWREVLRALAAPPPTVEVRGTGEPEPPRPERTAVDGTWQLPAELATAVGVAPEVRWTVRPLTDEEFEIELRARRTGPPGGAVLQAGLDDGAQRWISFTAGEGGEPRARLIGAGEPVSVRFRSESRGLG
ncbi:MULTISPECIES: hypothetical protein [unclassified Crossiella]|uniref:hypothetical protein n=1 Tax=unclassified Crossiella TaxID=2620835 RepID=UPI001FFF3B54|nr:MULTISPECIES: hypothetical protein [unclassified Crossiella]MCK2243620.1 hypothetical protein [Crossiella sp. S99.2]MCK2257478.1 hypothetical protein [Crossiella sp. S99.1]